MEKFPRWMPLLFMAFVLLLFLMYGGAGGPGGHPAPVAYTQFKALIEQNEVAAVSLSGNDVDGILKRAQPLGP
ncbi:MAG: ATP-dependent metallopeptidase FtsH/Yme1/Tma family protein, partial [Rhodospirillales bacterium]|nr:ATP-dependent metallopeptidase FtsH/Yme1/Tma family protein [Rhodospirillales bacterium]